MSNCIHDVEHWMLNGLTSVPTLWLEYKDLMNLRFGMFFKIFSSTHLPDIHLQSHFVGQQMIAMGGGFPSKVTYEPRTPTCFTVRAMPGLCSRK